VKVATVGAGLKPLKLVVAQRLPLPPLQIVRKRLNQPLTLAEKVRRAAISARVLDHHYVCKVVGQDCTIFHFAAKGRVFILHCCGGGWLVTAPPVPFASFTEIAPLLPLSTSI
jgi:hypothetical protein